MSRAVSSGKPDPVVYCKITHVKDDDWCPRTFRKITICSYYFWLFVQWPLLYIFLLYTTGTVRCQFFVGWKLLGVLHPKFKKKIHCEICTYFTKEGPISMIHLNSKVIFKVLNYFYCSLSFLNEECIATGNNIESTFCIFMVNIWSFLWVHCWHWCNREFDRTFPFFLRETWKMITIVLHYIQYLPFSFLHFPTQLVLNSPIILSPVF